MRELMLKLLTYEPFEKISGDTVPTKAEVDELYEKQKIEKTITKTESGCLL